jgi:hypothetical protein
MAEKVITRRRVLSDFGNDVIHEDVVEDSASSGLGVALAVALAIVALLALFALARGVFTPTTSSTPTNIQVNPGTVSTIR